MHLLYMCVCLSVRNEQHNTMSKLHQKFTKEGDLFLGQKVIEVQRIGAPQDIWYKLGNYSVVATVTS